MFDMRQIGRCSLSRRPCPETGHPIRRLATASIPQFQAPGTGTASNGQISHRAADSSRFAGPTGRR